MNVGHLPALDVTFKISVLILSSLVIVRFGHSKFCLYKIMDTPLSDSVAGNLLGHLKRSLRIHSEEYVHSNIRASQSTVL